MTHLQHFVVGTSDKTKSFPIFQKPRQKKNENNSASKIKIASGG